MSGRGLYTQLQFLPTSAGGSPYPSGFDKLHDIVVTKDGNDTTGDGSWSNPFLTIQKGLDTVGNDYNVWVGDGTYVENLTKSTNGFSLRSISDDYDKCIIDGNNTDVTLSINSLQNSLTMTVVRGFTIKNGLGTTYGGGIKIYPNPGAIGFSLINCKIYNNSATVGAGLYLHSGVTKSNIITNCLFTGNINTIGDGGAIYHSNGTLTMSGCTFTGNRSGVGSGDYGSCIYHAGTKDVSISNCVFKANPNGNSGMIFIISVTGNYTITDCLVYDNNVRYDGHFIGTYSTGSVSGTLLVNHCTVVDNAALDGSGPSSSAIYLPPAGAEVRNSIVYKNLGSDSSIRDVYDYGTNKVVNNSFLTDKWTGSGSNNLDEITSGDTVGFTDYANNDFTLTALSDCKNAADDGDDIGTRYFTELT